MPIKLKHTIRLLIALSSTPKPFRRRNALSRVLDAATTRGRGGVPGSRGGRGKVALSHARKASGLLLANHLYVLSDSTVALLCSLGRRRGAFYRPRRCG